jgi:hypothetical protein
MCMRDLEYHKHNLDIDLEAIGMVNIRIKQATV